MYNLFYPSLMNPSETVDLCRCITAGIKTHCKDNPYLSPIHDRMIAGIILTEEYQGRSRSNPHTVELNELRYERHQIITGMQEILSGRTKLRSLELQVAQSAEILIAIAHETPIKFKVSTITTNNHVNTRIRRLDTVENRNHLEITGVLFAFERLIQIQALIKEAVNSKDSVESTKRRGTVDVHVENLKTEIGYVLPYLESCSRTQPEIFNTLAKEIAETIHRIMTVVHMRRNRQTDNDPYIG